MNEIITRQFDGMDIEIAEIDGDLYFEVYSTGMALGQAKVSKGRLYPRKERIEENIKNAEIVPVVHNGQLYISEPQLYDFMFEVHTDKVKPFKKWVTSEVLPSIRKNGGYIAGQEILTDDELLEKAVLVARRKIKERDAIIEKQREKIEHDKPKTVFADAVATAKTSILIGELAKVLKQNGVDTGEKRLFEWLRNNGYLIRRKGTDYNAPTQKSMEMGLFEVKETAITHADGHVTVSKTTKVTGKGQNYFVNKFLGDDAA